MSDKLKTEESSQRFLQAFSLECVPLIARKWTENIKHDNKAIEELKLEFNRFTPSTKITDQITAFDGSMSKSPQYQNGACIYFYSWGKISFVNNQTIARGSANFGITNNMKDADIFGRLAMLYEERKMMLTERDKGSDGLFIMDGGFQTLGEIGHHKPMKGRIEFDQKKKELAIMTQELSNDPCLIAITKRASANALNGYLVASGKQPTLSHDKQLLDRLMPEYSVFYYPFDDAPVYSRLYREYLLANGGDSRTIGALKYRAEYLVNKDRKASGLQNLKEKRFWVRFERHTQPLQIHVSIKTDEKDLLNRISAVINRKTGLPLPADIVHKYVNIPRNYGDLVMRKVQAFLINQGMMDALSYTKTMNPQEAKN